MVEVGEGVLVAALVVVMVVESGMVGVSCQLVVLLVVVG